MKIQELFEAEDDQQKWFKAIVKDAVDRPPSEMKGTYDGYNINVGFKKGKIELVMVNGVGTHGLSFASQAEFKAYLDKQIALRKMTPAERNAHAKKAQDDERAGAKANRTAAKAAGKPTNKFDDIDEGDKPDAAIVKLFNKMARAAEKIQLKDAIDNFEYDGETTKAELRKGIHVWCQRLTAHENGFEVSLNTDLDDVGGDSTNYSELSFDLSGNYEENLKLGKAIATFEEQEGWERTD